MKANILSVEGKKLKEMELPKCFSSEIREDIVSRILEAKKIRQPYSPSPLAGNQYSASGKLIHTRNVWKSQYKRGMSRIPRKIMSRKGSQFVWIGATVPSTVGGRRAHPPKITEMINRKKINKKEMTIALKSAISATANKNEIKKKYSSLKNGEIKNLPLVVEGKFVSLKAKQIMESLKKILEGNLFEIAVRKKSVRRGKGKMRGRKYKENAGALIVLGKNEKIKTGLIQTANVKNLSIKNLAEGGQGRLVIYTENAINDLNEKYNGGRK